jgi:circadian clock protein KaiC
MGIAASTIFWAAVGRGQCFLLEGNPGTGKTTIATQFLMAGGGGRRTLYITCRDGGRAEAARTRTAGRSPRSRYRLLPPESLLDEDQQQSLLYSSDLELGETTRQIFEAFERAKPDRVVLDSLSEIRLLAQSSLRYRRQILALKHYFAQRNATVLLLDDLTTEVNDKTVHSVAHGVVRLEELAPEYGAAAGSRAQIPGQAVSRRTPRLRHRSRGRAVFHAAGGGRAQARVQARGPAFAKQGAERPARRRGGARVERAGAGAGWRSKSILTLTFIVSGAAQNARRFSCSTKSWACCSTGPRAWHRPSGDGRRGSLLIEQVDAAELTPGEFTERVRRAIEKKKAKTVVIDSLSSYQAAMPEERQLILHMHELLQCCNRRGATTSSPSRSTA